MQRSGNLVLVEIKMQPLSSLDQNGTNYIISAIPERKGGPICTKFGSPEGLSDDNMGLVTPPRRRLVPTATPMCQIFGPPMDTSRGDITQVPYLSYQ